VHPKAEVTKTDQGLLEIFHDNTSNKGCVLQIVVVVEEPNRVADARLTAAEIDELAV